MQTYLESLKDGQDADCNVNLSIVLAARLKATNENTAFAGEANQHELIKAADYTDEWYWTKKATSCL